jgi:hypothetical protein
MPNSLWVKISFKSKTKSWTNTKSQNTKKVNVFVLFPFTNKTKGKRESILNITSIPCRFEQNKKYIYKVSQVTNGLMPKKIPWGTTNKFRLNVGIYLPKWFKSIKSGQSCSISHLKKGTKSLVLEQYKLKGLCGEMEGGSKMGLNDVDLRTVLLLHFFLCLKRHHHEKSIKPVSASKQKLNWICGLNWQDPAKDGLRTFSSIHFSTSHELWATNFKLQLWATSYELRDTS